MAAIDGTMQKKDKNLLIRSIGDRLQLRQQRDTKTHYKHGSGSVLNNGDAELPLGTGEMNTKYEYDPTVDPA